ncbi:2-dehydro-3-deoxyphosphogluconate aldolase [Adhaeribacter arboris]|uniref:2-dehydro-3-deoxyphosphogluconate aldolase n=1 Tax=Adhaeribacter arboris TaxID=2072846 RepID=A0A2T2YEC3_9BACT|nr:bifunctional 4-hydroxy-2-oxoglutarate aldolase/2-dehydro-3-deoxy-phosphogluconate aldolase [Adhaeribacter arboris]PSR53852.1 2-dehydro-3-deoxyphosphogluconate aldolase [Adhaeribacter arboris]
MSHAFSWELFQRVPLIGIMRNLPPAASRQIAGLYAEAGLTTLEITLNSANAPKTISTLVNEFSGKLNIGAGTVCSLADLEQALAAGAQFIVTPILNPEVIKASLAAHIPIFPGSFSPTEIYQAAQLGASMIKVFPATKLGPEFIKDVLAPLSGLKLVPTGGISLSNITQFFQAGAQGVGIGSDIFPKQLIQNEQWPELKNLFLDFVKKYHQFKGLPSN